MSGAFHSLGGVLLLAGLLMAGIGAILLWGPAIPWLGRLPGDIAIRRDGFSFYLPMTSSLIISALVSLVLWLVGRGRP